RIIENAAIAMLAHRLKRVAGRRSDVAIVDDEGGARGRCELGADLRGDCIALGRYFDDRALVDIGECLSTGHKTNLKCPRSAEADAALHPPALPQFELADRKGIEEFIRDDKARPGGQSIEARMIRRGVSERLLLHFT